MRAFVVVLCCIPLTLCAQRPDWVSTPGQSASYPEGTYLSGFGIAALTPEAGPQQATGHAIAAARRNLVERIRVSVRSRVVSHTEEKDDVLSQCFSSVTEAVTDLDLEGLTDAHFIDEDAAQVYALSIIRRSSLERTYADRISRLHADVQARMKRADEAEHRGDRTKALREYLAVLPLVRQLDETRAILSAVRSTGSSTKPVSHDDTGVAASTMRVNDAISRILARPINSVDDAVAYLLFCLMEQTEQRSLIVAVDNPTYRDTQMGSSFARYLRQGLESKAAALGAWQVTSGETATEPGENREPVVDLQSAYWDQPDRVKVVCVLRDSRKGTVISSAEAFVPIQAVSGIGVALVPDNHKQVLDDERRFVKDEVLTGGLELTVRTNKGEGNPVFLRGERMHVFLEVNMPAAIRFVYHLADGTRALLLDNYRVDISHVGREIEIPQEFECDAPYGAEVLQVFATTGSFDPVRTVKREGYDILAETLDGFLSTTRGGRGGRTDNLHAEQRIVLTTMEK